MHSTYGSNRCPAGAARRITEEEEEDSFYEAAAGARTESGMLTRPSAASELSACQDLGLAPPWPAELRAQYLRSALDCVICTLLANSFGEFRKEPLTMRAGPTNQPIKSF